MRNLKFERSETGGEFLQLGVTLLYSLYMKKSVYILF